MPTLNSKLYEFGQFRLDAEKRLLLRSGEPVKLAAKTLDLLIYLVDNRNEVVDKEQLMLAVWPDAIVEDANLTVHISNLRKVLADDTTIAGKIETFPKKGYRFTADVNEIERPVNGGGRFADSKPAGDVGFVPADYDSDLLAADHHAPLQTERGAKLAAVIGIAALACVLLAGYFFVWDRSGLQKYKNITVERLTNLGVAVGPSVSPDGKYVVYGRQENDRFSVWLGVVGSTSETEIVPPTEGVFTAASFTADGKTIAYGARLKDQPLSIYVTPLLGGGTTKLPFRRTGRVSFSPDGQHLVYLDNNYSEGKTHVVIANPDGSEAKPITTRQAPNYYWTAIAASWSPDSRRIVCIAQNANESTGRVVEVDIETGTETPVTEQIWTSIRGVAWLPGGDGLLLVAAEETTSQYQIWHISYPGGAATRITNDPVSYFGISLSSDGNTIATIDRKTPASIWVAPVNGTGEATVTDVSKAVKIGDSHADGLNSADGYGGVNWTPDGRIIFTSEESGNSDIWSMNPDGSDRRQITTDRRRDTGPAVSPDGKSIVFMSTRTGTESLWMMDIDGGNQRRITQNLIERTPVFSADGRSLYFASWETGKSTVWRMPAEGGSPEQVVAEVSSWPKTSPDGRWLIYQSTKGLMLKDLHNQSPDRTLPMQGGQWGPAPNSISHFKVKNGVANIWLYFLDTGKSVQITNNGIEDVASYAWSRDGKMLAFTRAALANDVIVMTAK